MASFFAKPSAVAKKSWQRHFHFSGGGQKMSLIFQVGIRSDNERVALRSWRKRGVANNWGGEIFRHFLGVAKIGVVKFFDIFWGWRKKVSGKKKHG